MEPISEENPYYLLVDSVKNTIKKKFNGFLYIIVGIFFCFVLWVFLAQIPITVSGKGILASKDAISPIYSNVSGTVFEIHVQMGENINENQKIATIFDPTRQAQVNQLANLSSSIKSEQKLLSLYEKLLKVKQKLYHLGLVPSTHVLSTQEELLNKKIKIESLFRNFEGQLSDLESTFSIRDLFPEYKEITNILSFLNKEFVLQYSSPLIPIKSGVNGSIIGLSHQPGDLIERGDLLANIEKKSSKNSPLMVYAFFTPEKGAKIFPGMEARIYINPTLNRQIGYLIGRVHEISLYPVSEMEIHTLFPNNQIVKYLTNNGSSATQALIRLELTSNGEYLWEWNQKKKYDLKAGDVCDVKIVYEKRNPLFYLVPLWEYFVDSIENYQEAIQMRKRFEDRHEK